MSDSLRDQLLQAGFSELKPAQRRGKAKKKSAKSNRGKRNVANTKADGSKSPSQGQSDAEAVAAEQVAARKALKQQIRALIDEHRVKEHAGDEAYAYQSGNRVRQIWVKSALKEKLANGDLVITRLDGNTFLIPANIANEVKSLNPDWAVFSNQSDDKDNNTDPDYEGYDVPDDLSW